MAQSSIECSQLLAGPVWIGSLHESDATTANEVNLVSLSLSTIRPEMPCVTDSRWSTWRIVNCPGLRRRNAVAVSALLVVYFNKCS